MVRNLTRRVYLGSHGVKNGHIIVWEMKLGDADCKDVRGMKLDQDPKHCHSLLIMHWVLVPENQ
jgi:hypothetical protein